MFNIVYNEDLTKLVLHLKKILNIYISHCLPNLYLQLGDINNILYHLLYLIIIMNMLSHCLLYPINQIWLSDVKWRLLLWYHNTFEVWNILDFKFSKLKSFKKSFLKFNYSFNDILVFLFQGCHTIIIMFDWIWYYF